MNEQIKIRAQKQGDITEVKILLPHPMETGLRKDTKTGQPIPIHFIQQIGISVNGKKIIELQTSQAISRNPVLVFKVKHIKLRDEIAIDWLDNQGETNRNEIMIGNDSA